MDYSKEIFPLNNFALYCKGWYESSKGEDMFGTLSKVLKLDGYEFAKTKRDILCIVLNEMDGYNTWLFENKKQYLRIYDLYSDLYDSMNYYDSCDLEEGIMRKIISFISNKESSEIKLSKPLYNRKLWKYGLKFNGFFYKKKNGMTYSEQNRIASKIFDECI